MGLDESVYGFVKSNLLSRDPLPTLMKHTMWSLKSKSLNLLVGCLNKGMME